MATVNGFTAARMLGIENNSVVSGVVVGDNLVLTRQSGATIAAGNVRGPTGSPGVTTGELSAAFPVGMIVDYISTIAPTNWLTMVGQTIVGGQTLHPALWAVLPASMKVGSDIVMPNTQGKVSVGYDSADVSFDTIGETGGSKTHTLTSAEMPSHVHTGPSHSHTGPSHLHTIDHSHTASSGGHSVTHSHAFTATVTDPGHTHGKIMHPGSGTYVGTGNVVTPGGGPYIGINRDSNPETGNISTSHDVTGITASGNTGGTSVDHSHGITVNALSGGASGLSGTTATGLSGTANTGTMGSDNAHNNLQPYVVFLKIIKAA